MCVTMELKTFLLGATVLCVFSGTCFAQKGKIGVPHNRFTCQGRGAGYYADVDSGCQVYHMCDGLGRQFTYSCPNTTLFQQRMLICDHWYMVNCSRSELDYSANLLIGQRDKPFVSEAEMSLRTPRPDILSVPPNHHYYRGLQEAQTKFPIHPDNNIVGIGDSISSNGNDGLDHKHPYRPPTSWSTGTAHASHHHQEHNDNLNKDTGLQINHQQNFDHHTGNTHNSNQDALFNVDRLEIDSLTGEASQNPKPTFQPTPSNIPTAGSKPTPTPPSKLLLPPPVQQSSEEFQLDIRMKDNDDPVYNFIKRFDPEAPDSHKTSMSTSEILNINSQLPTNQDVSHEDERTPRRNKDIGNHFNTVQAKDKDATDVNKFNSVNEKITTISDTDNNFIAAEAEQKNRIKVPERDLFPPKRDQSILPSTTMGPPIYYEWKWAVPAFDLEPPFASNMTREGSPPVAPAPIHKSPFADVTRPTPRTVRVTPPNTEYNTSSYFVPDYVFPLDREHPGYENDNAETSFRVKVSRPGRASYGENPSCPHCHPAYLTPGTCQPCIVKR